MSLDYICILEVFVFDCFLVNGFNFKFFGIFYLIERDFIKNICLEKILVELLEDSYSKD